MLLLLPSSRALNEVSRRPAQGGSFIEGEFRRTR
jgi:hypothetical protein